MAWGERDSHLILEFAEDHSISAFDLSAFIFDFNRIYVTAFRSLNGELAASGSGPFAFRRNNFRLPSESRLEIVKIRFQSPGIIEVVGIVGAIWVLVQIVDKVSLWPLNKRKLRAEVEKLERENRNAQLRTPLEIAQSSQNVESAIRQLELNPLKPHDLILKTDIGKHSPD